MSDTQKEQTFPNSGDLYDTPWIHTQYGRFNLHDPSFDERAIAHALGQLTRYNGHGAKFYSVAEHSLMVAGLMQSLGFGDPFEGLMHDATEAYLSDIPAPFKRQLPDWKAIDAKLDLELRKHYKLPEHKTVGCKKADWLALFIEAYHLVPGQGADFEDPLGLRHEALQLVHGRPPWRVQGLDPVPAGTLWLEAFRYYGPKIQIV